jgi:glutamine amidotransferase-like uncharacterized protein
MVNIRCGKTLNIVNAKPLNFWCVKMKTFGKMLWIPLCLVILATIPPLAVKEVKALQGAQVAIYNDTGAWADGVVAFEKFLDYKNMTWEEVKGRDINTNNLTALYDALYMPGGNSAWYKKRISRSGEQNIRDLVSSGGGYIGICAGAYYACDMIIWEGDEYDNPLDLYDGYGIGALYEIQPWDYSDMTYVSMVSSHPINQYEPAKERSLYWGGPRFEGGTYDTVATYDEVNDAPAIITCSYGSGRVILFGPHPEIEEDSDRDSSDFAEIFYDQGSEWPLLWTSMDWLMGLSISEPPDEPPLPPEGTQLFFDDFESGDFETKGWVTYGDGAPWFVSTEKPWKGTYHAMAKKTGVNKYSYLEISVSTSGYTNMVSVRYFRQIIGHDAADSFRVEWYDGTDWNLIEEKNKFNQPDYTDPWVFLPSDAFDNSNFKLRFVDECGAASEKVYLDNVEIRAD